MAVHSFENPLARLADVLRSARRDCGCSITDVEARTMVRASYVEALEASRYFELPPQVYARRILRTLCDFYALDPDRVLALYESEYATFVATEQRFQSQNLDRLPAHVTAEKPGADTPIHAYHIAGVVAAVLAVTALGGYVVDQLQSFSAPPRLVIKEPSGDVRVDHRTIIVRGQADIGSTISINNLSVLTNEVGAFQVPYELSPGQNVITVVAQRENGKSVRVSRTVSADFTDPVPEMPDRGFLAVVSSNEPTWVSVRLDGDVTFEGTIDPEADRSFTGTSDLQVQTRNAGATRIAINGHDQGPIGRSGQRGTFRYAGTSAVGMAELPGTTPTR